jgi:uncharacterized protein YcbK (DUF882 family)
MWRSLPSPRVFAGLSIWLIFATSAPMARAEREHLVRQGQSLGRIAERYGVSASDLAARNRMRRDASLRAGQVLIVPERGVVYVRPGQSLAGIASANSVDAGELATHNRLKANAPLKVGQVLRLPGIAPENAPSSRWGSPKRPGVATIHRIALNKTRRVQLIDKRGRLRDASIREMRDLLRPRDSRRRRNPHPRLLRLLAQVSDHFGGRPIHVVSGYRLPGGFTRDSSRHVAGEAIDFRIPGVPLNELRAFCEHFDHVGVGYYPRSRFVHLDVRRKRTRWTDWSLPGQGPVADRPAEIADNATDEDIEKAGANTQAPHDAQDERELQESPPAEDDGLPPIDDATEAVPL